MHVSQQSNTSASIKQSSVPNSQTKIPVRITDDYLINNLDLATKLNLNTHKNTTTPGNTLSPSKSSSSSSSSSSSENSSSGYSAGSSSNNEFVLSSRTTKNRNK
jgi:hypothetical protein